MKWALKKEKLDHLDEVNEDVIFGVGAVETAEGSNEKLRMQVGKVVEELNARNA